MGPLTGSRPGRLRAAIPAGARTAARVERDCDGGRRGLDAVARSRPDGPESAERRR
jgi:hypothetical protein